MDKFEVNLGVLREEKMRLDKLMNDYEECVELIGHLTRVFNREGYWDFKESLNGVYKRACKHENDLSNLIECIQQVHDIYMESEDVLVDEVDTKQQEVYVPDNDLNVEYILGGMRPLTQDESYKLIKSLSIRGDINLGIDAALLLATTTLHTYTSNQGHSGFKLKESDNETYTDRFKLFESQTEVKWSSYGVNLADKVDVSVYTSESPNNGLPEVIRSTPQEKQENNIISDISKIMLEAITESDKEYIKCVEPEVNEIHNNSVLYEMDMGHRIINSLFKNLA